MTTDCQDILNALEKRLQMIWQEKRLDTFKNWPFKDGPCRAEKMAEAGFFFTGSLREPDSVQCFLCEKPLDGWDEEDDPWAEHFSHAPNCAFAKLGQPEEALTFTQLINFHMELSEKQLEKSMIRLQSTTNKIFNTRLAKHRRALQTLKKYRVKEEVK